MPLCQEPSPAGKKPRKSSSFLSRHFGEALFLIVGFLLTGNAYFASYHNKNKDLETQLFYANSLAKSRNAQLINTRVKLQTTQNIINTDKEQGLPLSPLIQANNSTLNNSKNIFSPTSYTLAPQHTFSPDKINLLLNNFFQKVKKPNVPENRSESKVAKKAAVLSEPPEPPAIWPTTGTISGAFGSRYSAFLHRRELHKGLDIKADVGTPVLATAKGVVVRSEKTPRYGNCVDIDHCNNLVTRYAHMQKSVVNEGDAVTQGEIIGYVGSSGLSSGPHLHYEVRKNGVPVNPAKYISSTKEASAGDLPETSPKTSPEFSTKSSSSGGEQAKLLSPPTSKRSRKQHLKLSLP